MTRAFVPSDLSEAVALLADRDLGAIPVAGCTDLLVVDTATGRRHPAVVDVSRLRELRGLELDDGCVDIGAAVTFSELRRDARVSERLPILSQAAATIGGWQIQNRATLGGNIVNASPIGDSLPVLLALDAELLVYGPEGVRRIPYDAWHQGYRKTALVPGELLVRVRIPLPARDAVQAFKKVGTREAQAISKVVVAFCARRSDAPSSEAGRLTQVRIAAGGVAAEPKRLRAAEAACEGQPPVGSTAERVAAAARGEVSPLDDVRSSADYRRHALGQVIRRMVLEALPNQVHRRTPLQ